MIIQDRYAIFIQVSGEYLHYLTAQLQSIHENKPAHMGLDIFVFYDSESVDIDALKATPVIERLNDYNQNKVDFTPINREHFEKSPTIQSMNSVEFNKRARFYYMDSILKSRNYSGVCLMDADMFIVSERFFDLFSFVADTDMMIVCNEKIKWNVEEKYYRVKEDKKIYEKWSKKLYRMHCSVPIFFSPQHWSTILREYLYNAENLREFKKGKERFVGDIFCWNITMNRYQDKVISFPMETMTQVHQTNGRELTRIIVEPELNYWVTVSGDQVFCVHGKFSETSFIEDILKYSKENGQEEHIKDIEESLRMIQKEWFTLYGKAIA